MPSLLTSSPLPCTQHFSGHCQKNKTKLPERIVSRRLYSRTHILHMFKVIYDQILITETNDGSQH